LESIFAHPLLFISKRGWKSGPFFSDLTPIESISYDFFSRKKTVILLYYFFIIEEENLFQQAKIQAKIKPEGVLKERS
jgi:hypothetical protein